MTKHTLLLRLAGPMQSWGVQSRFTERDTALEPTKSGVVGLVCAALGRPRDTDITDVAALRMGVRVDREGRVRRDFHTAGREGFLRARGAVERKQLIVTNRFYLSDAHFTVGLEGNNDQLRLLNDIQKALRRPHWPLALGRKAFTPGCPVHLPDGLQENVPLREALITFPWKKPLHLRKPPDTLRYVFEPGEDGWDEEKDIIRRMQPDQPLSFQPRRFALRSLCIKEENVTMPVVETSTCI